MVHVTSVDRLQAVGSTAGRLRVDDSRAKHRLEAGRYPSTVLNHGPHGGAPTAKSVTQYGGTRTALR